MKTGTPNHPKTATLAQALKVERWGAVGILESLWLWTAEYAPDGAIGRFTDQAIADGIAWKGNARKLVGILIRTEWVDRAPDPVRLVIHDWSAHASDHVHRKLVRSASAFADGMPPKLTKATEDERRRFAEKQGESVETRGTGRGAAERVPDQTRPVPYQTQPDQNQTPPLPPSVSDSDPCISVGRSGSEMPEDWDAFQCVRFVCNNAPSKRATTTLEDLTAKIPPDKVRAACIEVLALKRTGKADNPAGMLTTLLRRHYEAYRGPAPVDTVVADYLAKQMASPEQQRKRRPG